MIAAEVRELLKRRIGSLSARISRHDLSVCGPLRLRGDRRAGRPARDAAWHLPGLGIPCTVLRDRIERTFGVPCLSWYGHSEMAVFAYEKDRPFEYSPMHTYGYVEAIRHADGEFHLIGTSYDNEAITVHPL